MEFNTGGTADSSNSGAMTGGTMASSMYKNGGGVGRFKVGVFNEQQLRNKEDKKAVEKAQRETGLKYVDTKMIKKGGKMYLEVYLIPNEEYYESSKFAKGGGLKPIPKGNKGLPKLPKSVRNKMGYMAKGGGVGKNKKPKYKIGQLVYSYQNKDTKYPINYIKDADDLGIIRYRISLPDGNSNWINEEGIYTNSISGKKMAKGGSIENYKIIPYKSRLGDLIEPNYSNAYTISGSLSEANDSALNYVKINDEIVQADVIKIHPSGKPLKHKKVSIATKNGIKKMEWGGTAESSETGEFIGGENQSSMFENGGVSTGFTYDIGGL